MLSVLYNDSLAIIDLECHYQNSKNVFNICFDKSHYEKQTEFQVNSTEYADAFCEKLPWLVMCEYVL